MDTVGFRGCNKENLVSKQEATVTTSNSTTVKTTQWGPSAWKWLHSMTVCNPKRADKRPALASVLRNIYHVLPCAKCRQSYGRFTRQQKMQPTTDLRQWLFNIHNRVNQKLDKPIIPQHRYDATMRVYEDDLKQHQPQPADAFAEDMWYFLFAVAANYRPIDVKRAYYRRFLRTIGAALAESCDSQTLGPMWSQAAQSPTLDAVLGQGRESLMRWMYALYRETETAAQRRVIPWNEVVGAMDEMRACTKSQTSACDCKVNK